MKLEIGHWALGIGRWAVAYVGEALLGQVVDELPIDEDRAAVADDLLHLVEGEGEGEGEGGGEGWGWGRVRGEGRGAREVVVVWRRWGGGRGGMLRISLRTTY